jgi:hypothetical protein
VTPVLTDAAGRPIAPPERPRPGASIEERIAYIRAFHAYRDTVAGCASEAFAVAFRREVGKEIVSR